MSGIVTLSRIIGAQSRAALIESNIGVLKDLLLARFLPLVKKSRTPRK